VDDKSIKEAEDALSLEENGDVPGPVRRADGRTNPRENGADFVDGEEALWDHKNATSEYRPFDEETFLDDLEFNDIRNGEDIMLNHEGLQPGEFADLLEEIESRGLMEKFRFLATAMTDVIDKDELERLIERHARWNERGDHDPDGQLKLVGARLGAIDLSGRALNGAVLYKADLSRARLVATDLSRAILDDAVLDDADLTQANLLKAELTGASLRRAVLRAAFAKRANFGKANLTGADLTGAVIIYGYLMETDFTDARLDGADVTGCGIRGVRLQGATLHGLRGIEQAQILSIDIGSADAPELLEGDAAVAWLLAASNSAAS
jgi:uncharacterized protein YjbI with pentapeptide repeats